MLSQRFAFVALSASAFAISVFQHMMNLWTAHYFVKEEHDDPLWLDVPLTVILVLVFGFMVRYVLGIRTLYGWCICGAGAAAVLFPIGTIVMMVGGRDIHLAIASQHGMPSGLLASLYAVAICGGGVYGALGWFWLRRMSFTSTAKL